jgi:hypothetical protein
MGQKTTNVLVTIPEDQVEELKRILGEHLPTRFIFEDLSKKETKFDFKNHDVLDHNDCRAAVERKLLADQLFDAGDFNGLFKVIDFSKIPKSAYWWIHINAKEHHEESSEFPETLTVNDLTKRTVIYALQAALAEGLNVWDRG